MDKIQNKLQTTWNLAQLFTDDFDPKIETEKVKIQEEADQFVAKWENRTDWLTDAKILAQILNDYQDWLTNWGFYGKVGYYFFLRTSQDSIDPILKAKSNQIEEISTKIANQMQFVELRISKIEKVKQQEFLQSEELLEFRHFLERIFEASQYLLSESEEKIVNLLSFHKGKWSDMVEEFLNSESIELEENYEKIESGKVENSKNLETKTLKKTDFEEMIFGKKDEMVSDFDSTNIFVIYNQKTRLLAHKYNLETWKNYNSLLCFEDEMELQKQLELGTEDYNIYDLNSKFINYTNYCNFEYLPKFLVITNQNEELQKKLGEILVWETKKKMLEKFENLVQKDSENSSKINLSILKKGIVKIAELGLKNLENSDLESQKMIENNDKNSKKNIIFDWFGVLFTDGEQNLVSEIGKYLKLKNQETDIWNLVRKEDSGKLISVEFTNEINKICSKVWTAKEIYDLWENSIETIKMTQEFIAQNWQNYNFYYLTNISKENFEVRQNHSILKNFQGGIASFQTEFAKPNPEIYQELLKKYDLESKNCLFIDDKIENIKTAQNLGMQTILFDQSVNNLEEKIENINLEKKRNSQNQVQQMDLPIAIDLQKMVESVNLAIENSQKMSDNLNQNKNIELVKNFEITKEANNKTLENSQNYQQNWKNENTETKVIKLTFEELMTKMSDPNQEIRGRAVIKFDQIMEKYKPIATYELNAILRHKQVIDELRGYPNPDSARLASDDVDPQIVKTLLESVKSRFEISHNYYKLKAKLMGRDKLKYHERNVEYGKVVQNYTFEQGVEILRRVFAKLDNAGNSSEKMENNQNTKNTDSIKAILFDLDGVLIQTFFEGQKIFAHSLLLEKKYNIKTGQTQEFWQKVFPNCVIGKADLKEILPQYLSKWKYPNSVDEYVKEWILNDNYVYEKNLELAKKLKKDGYQIYIATNQEKYKTEWLKKEFDGIFDGIFSSFDLKITKESPNFWQKVGESLCLEFGEMLLIDDIEENVEIARNLGMQTILFDESCDNLEEKIEQILESKIVEKKQNYNLTWEKYQNLVIEVKDLLNSENNLDEKVILRSLNMSDAKEILAQNKGNVVEYFMKFTNLENVENWITKILEEIKHQEKLELVIEKTGKFVGMLSLRNLQTKPEFGLWICQNFQKMGIAKNSMTTFIDWIWTNTAFEKLFYTGIDSQNIPSQNLAKSLQAEKIGEFDFVFNRKNIDKTEIDSQNVQTSQIQDSKKVSNTEFSDILEDYLAGGKIDVYPRTGKRGGAFMTGNTGRIIDPTFIFLNWTNTLNDVQTFAHEMGHACNYEMMKKTNKTLTWDGSYLTMESPSTFMEDFILEDILEHCVDKEERLAILMKKLNDDISSIFRQISLYLFELELHSEFRKAGYLSGEQIGELFQKHMSNYMGNAVEKSEGSKNWWIYWSHIRYMFYVYSYGAGLLISKSMQKRLKDNPSFIANIKEFYAAGMNKTPVQNLLEKLQIDATKSDIWLEGLEQTSKNLEMAEKLARELNLI